METIPNLNTLRFGRRGPRLRAVRRAFQDPTKDHGEANDDCESVERARDKIIQQTDGDASSSRISAVSLGYLDDPYASQLYPLAEPPKRYPIINRGTYVRTQAIDHLVIRFLETDPPQRKQIISLGAGSDTRFFRLCANKYPVSYHELDFEGNVNQKRDAIRRSEHLASMALAQEGGSSYHLHAIDIRVLTHKSPPVLPALERNPPTLIISECCLCYFPPDLAVSVLNYFTMHLTGERGMILYEPIRPFDAFGKTMMSNLASRGIELRTLKRYYSLESQRQRLRLAGFDHGQGARDVNQIYGSSGWVDDTDRERIEKIEWLDEVEEWELLARHYCVAWGWNGQQLFGNAWRDIEGARTDDEALDEKFTR